MVLKKIKIESLLLDKEHNKTYKRYLENFTQKIHYILGTEHNNIYI